MEILQKIKNTNSSNEKLELLRNNLTSEVELLLRASLDDRRFGLSSKTLMKVYGIKSLQGYNDVGDWIENSNKIFNFEYDSPNCFLYDLEFNIFKFCEKYSGNKLIEYLRHITSIMTKEQNIWVSRALLKDLKINMGITQVNKVFKELNKPLIETFQVQLCKSLKINELSKLNSYPYYCETKYDGTRSIIYIEKRTSNNPIISLLEEPIKEYTYNIKIKSRAGKDTTSQFPEIVKEIVYFAMKNNLSNTILDGEIISKDFNSLQKRLGRKSDNIEFDNSLKFICFDILKYEGINYKDRQFKVRTETLFNLKYSDKIEYSNPMFCFNKSEIEKFYEQNCNNKEEGIIIKDVNGLYAEEKKDERKNQWKVKPEETMDLYVTGCEFGTGRHSNVIGAIHLSNKDGTIICKCGSGFSDEERKRLTQLHIENRGLKGRIVEVKYWEIQKPNEQGISSLRFPIYVCLREDKFESD